MQAQEGHGKDGRHGAWRRLCWIMGVDRNKAPGTTITANTNNKFKMAAKWLRSGKHKRRQRRA